MRAVRLCFAALALAGCETDEETAKSSQAPAVEAQPSEPEAVPRLPPDAPAIRWEVRGRHDRLFQIDADAWAELTMELLSGVIETEVVDDGIRITMMGRGSVTEMIGLREDDVLTAYGSAIPATPGGLHNAWATGHRTNWIRVKRRRGEAVETVHLWIGDGGRTRKDELAAALCHVGIEELDESRRRVDRSLLAAIGKKPRLAKVELLWQAFGVPEDANIIRIDDETVDDRRPEEVLEAIARRSSERAFELLVVDGARELHLQYEVVDGLVDDTVLEAIRDVPERSSAAPSSRRRPFGELFGRSRPSRRPSEDLEDPFEATQRVSIDASVFNELMDDPAKLSRSARVVPSMEDGRTTGYKLYGIRPSSLLSEAGFKNGDKIMEIQGRRIGRMEDVLDAYKELRADDLEEIRFTLERRGRELELTIELE